MITVMNTGQADLALEYHGSVVVFEINTPEADAWALSRDDLQGWMWLGRHRFAIDTSMSAAWLDAMLADGLSVERA